ncbi:glutamate synthase [Moniliophthora roreri]|nr:glutamate synthase [Moniliophthora roreri]
MSSSTSISLFILPSFCCARFFGIMALFWTSRCQASCWSIITTVKERWNIAATVETDSTA